MEWIGRVAPAMSSLRRTFIFAPFAVSVAPAVVSLVSVGRVVSGARAAALEAEFAFASAGGFVLV